MKTQHENIDELTTQKDVTIKEAQTASFDEKFDFLSNAAPIGLSISDIKGTIISANKAIRDAMGYTEDELKGMNLSDLYADPAERSRLIEILNKSGHVRDFETKIKNKDGTLWTVLMNADYIEIDHAKLLLTSVYDITEYKHVQEELEASEERYHLLFSNAPVGITVTDSAGSLLASNQALLELLGYNAEEVKTLNARDFYLNKTERQRLVDMMKNTGTVRDFETKFLRKSGSVINVLINADMIDFKDQHNVFLTSIRDITNIKIIEEELTAERDFTNAILDTAASLILVLDRQGCITRFNQACEDTTGYTFQEIKGQHMWDILSANPEKTREKVDALLRGKYPSTHENFWLTKSGEQRLVSWSSTVLLDNEGEVGYIIATGIDVTEQRLAAETLQSKTTLLEAQINASLDGVMITDENMKLVTANHKFYEMLSVPQHIIDDKDHALLFKHSLDQSKNPDAFLKVIEYLASNPKEISKGEDEFKNGMILERYSAPVINQEGKSCGRIWTFHDITDQKKLKIALQEANQKLSNWVDELEERATEMRQMSEMGEQLHTCQTLEEACAISAQYIRIICPDSKGAIYLINPSKDMAEAVEMWGGDDFTEKVFLPKNCWAIRRSRPHLVDETHPGLYCGHIINPKDGMYLCVPMMAHGETTGILHLKYVMPDQEHAKETHIQHCENKMQVIMEVAEHVALALSNLSLREALRQQSIRDVLTGLFNRRYMEETLARELLRAEREKKSVGLIMFDIDHFKEFNDLAGHDGGDALLRELGDFMKKNTRGGDIVCRFGGEEFVSVLPGATVEEGRQKAEEMREGVKQLLVYHMGKPLGKCTISLGVAAYPAHGQSGEEILKSADKALYQAKNTGRDRVVVAQDTLFASIKLD